MSSDSRSVGKIEGVVDFGDVGVCGIVCMDPWDSFAPDSGVWGSRSASATFSWVALLLESLPLSARISRMSESTSFTSASVAPCIIRPRSLARSSVFASSLVLMVRTSRRSVNAATSVTVPSTLAAATFVAAFTSGSMTVCTREWITRALNCAGVWYAAASFASL